MTDGEFGTALALSADASTLVVGAPQESVGEGVVYVYVAAPGSGLWNLQRKLLPIDVGGVGMGNFGTSVALSAAGDTLAVGVPALAAVVLYVRNASGVWTNQTGLFSAPTSTFLSLFGWSVSMNAAGDALAVGAPFDSTGATYAGAVYTMTRSAGGVWGTPRFVNVSNSEPMGTPWFGYWVSMAAQGSLVVGAPMAVPSGAWWSVLTGDNGTQYWRK
jgi:hypothetical protein